MDKQHPGASAPPNDMAVEEVLRWLRIATDLQIVAAGVAAEAAKPTQAGGPHTPADLSVIQDLTSGALHRLSNDGDTLIRWARKVGDVGFEIALSHAQMLDPQILARLRQKASAEGGFVSMMERQLSNMATVFSAQLASTTPSLDSMRNPDKGGVAKGPALLNASSSATCALGVALAVHGVIGGTLGSAAVFAGAPIGVVPAILGAGEASYGATLIGSSC